MFSLGKESQLDRTKPSIVHLYIIRGIITNRIQVFSPDASKFLQPYLTALNANEPHPDIKFRATSSYEQVVERRGAELIIRLASNIQYQKDILNVISQIRQLDFFTYDQNFIDQAKSIIEKLYGPPPIFSQDLTTIIDSSKMVITKQSCEEALQLFINLLMPQHFILMNYRTSADTNETPTELKHQTEILKLPYQLFYKTTLFGNQGILKNIHKDEVEHLLNRMVRRGILKKGKFLKSLKQNSIHESYLKYLPFDASQETNLIHELKKNNIKFDEYRDIYKNSAISPDGSVVTDDGEKEIRKQNINFMMLNEKQRSYDSQDNSDSLNGDERLFDNGDIGNGEYQLY